MSERMVSDPNGGTSAPLDALRAQADKAAARYRWAVFGVFGVVLAYLAFSFVHFDLANVARKWSPDRASLFLLDSYAHKDHVEMRWTKPDEVEVSFEGGHRYVYDPAPDWFIDLGGDRGKVVTFEGHEGTITFFRDRIEMANWRDRDETFVFRRTPALNDDGTPRTSSGGRPAYAPYVEGYRTPEAIATLPDWIRVTENKVEVRPSLYERLQVYGTKVEIHRYALGWKYFLFDFDSPLRDVGLVDAVGLMFSGDRVVADQSNASLVLQEFLNNSMWFHGDVLFAMLETVLMALIGTFLACLVGLPLAFLAASNVTPFSGVRFVLRRLFDFLRGIDMLIWSLIFLRAFGPGLFTGIFAIAFTDTGTMGKLMSEAIENTDSKQREGVQSTGATRVQQNRFGVIPQILPVFISQSLYYLESNTRGAVIIGAMGAGGIGLQFLGAIQTGTDWENVAYMAILVLLTVTLMDLFSAALRRALIGGRSETSRAASLARRSAAGTTPAGPAPAGPAPTTVS